MASCTARMEWAARWLAHIGNRLEYERAMLGESGGIAAARFDIKAGGRVLIGDEWCVVLRLNKSGGKVVSVTTNARYVGVRGIEEVKDYRDPTPEDADKVEKVAKLAPLCNYRSDGCHEMTTEEWKRATRHSDSYFVESIKATDELQAHRRRTACSSAGGWKRVPVFLTDAKETPPPKIGAPAKGAVRGPWTKDPADVKPAEPVTFEREFTPDSTRGAQHVEQPREVNEFEAMKEALRTGVQVVAAPQLFPTPPDLAARMVQEADIVRGHRVLEPSAGTGRILAAIREATGGSAVRTAFEISSGLCDRLRITEEGADVFCRDFLAVDPDEFPRFDRVLMNPPFANGTDVEHVTHAARFLAAGGRLVAIMSAGVTFRDDRKTRDFRALVERMGGVIEPLPDGTFEASGTGVRTVLVVLDAPEASNGVADRVDAGAAA